MKRQEFVNTLRTALSGRIPAESVAENVKYYEDYINIEIRKGRSEEEVLDELGDPRLIAKTIIQTQGAREEEYRAGREGQSYNGGFVGGFSRQEEDEGAPAGGLRSRIKLWAFVIVGAVVFVLILSVIFHLFLYFLYIVLPVVLLIALVSFVVKLFRDWLT